MSYKKEQRKYVLLGNKNILDMARQKKIQNPLPFFVCFEVVVKSLDPAISIFDFVARTMSKLIGFHNVMLILVLVIYQFLVTTVSQQQEQLSFSAKMIEDRLT